MKHWYTNDIEEHQFAEGEIIPDNWHRGRSKVTIQKQIATELSKDENTRKQQYLHRADTNKKAAHKRSDESKEKMRQAKANYIPWNKGLTKETDDRVRLNAEHTSMTNIQKCKGLKLENPEYFKSWRAKARKTMHKNNTSRSSHPEDKYFEYLLTIYDESDIYRHYSSDPRYPFECDFYIKSVDLFIECNFHPSHGSHPFDETNPEDIKYRDILLNENTKWSRMILDVWTKRDVLKLKTANENNLNYKTIYN